ncbi:IS66 family insertion sequence element accessory protein TnpB [Variovorax sp. RTB1]|uniref:IS66 family insertion sequence element accessory protein TnpB n=1 Tax=Variovorax sp. RTB1 TaxID=3048631 RepID=UPI002B23CB04|nr:IS66 family insertion sequence element accessory protein TnpB [Variovorax sp. RTB1]MEB0114803.1 IS66 family insertion sequence element accessory protein TnpB [Variovorax sp. RTB1]
MPKSSVTFAEIRTNRRANRMKVLVHDGFGLWLCARRLHQGHFVWPHLTSTSMSVPGTPDAPPSLTLSRAQLDALVLGLPWQRLADAGAGAGAIHII